MRLVLLLSNSVMTFFLPLRRFLFTEEGVACLGIVVVSSM